MLIFFMSRILQTDTNDRRGSSCTYCIFLARGGSSRRAVSMINISVENFSEGMEGVASCFYC